MNEGSQLLITEFFPVVTDELLPLASYVLDINGGDPATIGGKLAYRLKQAFPGHWAWAGGRIVTDEPQSENSIMEVVRTLWAEQPAIFRGLRGVSQGDEWSPAPGAIAEFVARGLFSDYEGEIREILHAKQQDLGNAYMERVYETRSWTVRGDPAVSVSVSSRLLHKLDLAAYIAAQGVNDLEGLEVADKTSTLKGVIEEIVGPLAGERVRLLAVAQREEMQEIIAHAPDDELVVKVSTGYGYPYDYTVSALRIVLRTEHFRRFHVHAPKALAAMRMAPQQRADIIRTISEVVQRKYVGTAYNSQTTPDLFHTIPYSGQVLVGGGRIVPYDDTLLKSLQRHGLYKVAERFKAGGPVRIGFVSASGRVPFEGFWSQIEGKLRALRFSVLKAGQVEVSGSSRSELDRAITQMQANKPDVILAFLPDQYGDEEDDESAYYHFKSLTVGRGIASQVIEQSTIGKQYAIGNIVMGILGKAGNIPFVLATPLDFADVIVGIDVARERKKTLPGSTTAITRIYLNNGEFLQYAIHDAPLEGETIPPDMVQSLFPLSDFAGKRVVIHRDGYFRGNERQALRDWAKEIGATFYLVQVIKSGAPRLYTYENKQFVQPQKGSAFLIGDTEALLVSSLPPFENATPRPLRIIVDRPFPIVQALSSVLAMTDLHYGSSRAPRLPVTIHYGDKIASMALKGIKPQSLVGTAPYWL